MLWLFKQPEDKATNKTNYQFWQSDNHAELCFSLPFGWQNVLYATFYLNVQHHAFWTQSACDGWFAYLTVQRMRWVCHHLLYNIEKNYHLFSFVTHHCGKEENALIVPRYARMETAPAPCIRFGVTWARQLLFPALPLAGGCLRESLSGPLSRTAVWLSAGCIPSFYPSLASHRSKFKANYIAPAG